MKAFLRIIPASFLQALTELRYNQTRSILSLLGITIGIFCIMSIKSAVDSLEANIKESFEKLGEDVLLDWIIGRNQGRRDRRRDQADDDDPAQYDRNVHPARQAEGAAFGVGGLDAHLYCTRGSRKP